MTDAFVDGGVSGINSFSIISDIGGTDGPIITLIKITFNYKSKRMPAVDKIIYPCPAMMLVIFCFINGMLIKFRRQAVAGKSLIN